MSNHDFAVDSGSLWGRLGVTLGSTRADFGGILGRLWGVRGRSGEVREGSGRAPGGRTFFFHFKKFKIKKLFEGFSLLLKRLEMDLNEFFDDIFSECGFYLVFSGVIYTKFSGFFPMNFTIKKSI